MNKSIVIIFIIVAFVNVNADSFVGRMLGGETTIAASDANAFSQPARNMSILDKDRFFIGNAFFRNPWVSAPASTTARDGLGPLFNANTCQGCHVKDGRGTVPENILDPLQSALVRLSIPADEEADKEWLIMHGSKPEPIYGGQLQPFANTGVAKEGVATLRYEFIDGKYPDGKPFELARPLLAISDLGYGALHPQLMTSVRVAPAMIGLGLLEAIPEASIDHYVDPNDDNKDGISGKKNRVWDVDKKMSVMGRFGWKAGQPTVRQQSAAAFIGDMGLTTSLFPIQECSKAQEQCAKAPHDGVPEVTDEIFENIIFYASTLAVPVMRNVNDPDVKSGYELFAKIGCNQCHVDSYVTDKNAEFGLLAEQTIHPYTDLLLHDMGEGLADVGMEFLASGSEWRTPPLWGLGLTLTVNKHTRLLHDGRARNVEEAILWHGGEAAAAKDRFMSLSETERDQLLTFLNAL